MQSCLSAFDRSLEVVKEEMECDDEESGTWVVNEDFTDFFWFASNIRVGCPCQAEVVQFR